MKPILFLFLLAASYPAFAAEDSSPAADPFAGALFPPELVLLAHDHIALTQAQEDALTACIAKAKPRFEQLRPKMESETAALAALAAPDHVDEAALGAQLDKVLDSEREMKHLQLGLMVAIKNLLTPEQQAKLHDIAKTGAGQLEDDTRKRLTEKVDLVKQGAQKWVDSGRDPSAIGQMMTDDFKPLIDAGKVIEAEAVLDRVLAQLNQAPK